MLNTLYIKNFALIDELTVDFSAGLNIITGETGAGKSIMVDAFMVALGDRASGSMVRRDTKKAIIEATFDTEDNPYVRAFLTENDIEFDEKELILRREISSSGSTRCFVCDSPVSVSMQKDLGNLLVDFHGQHEHQQLLDSKFHINILDSICDFGSVLDEYRTEYKNQKKLISEYKDTLKHANEAGIRLDNYTFELNEIQKIDPQENELDELEAKLKLAENAETIFSLCNSVINELDEDEKSATASLDKSEKTLERLSGFDDEFAEYLAECRSAIVSIREIVKFTYSYRGRFVFDEKEIEDMRQRVYQLNRLRKKYSTYEAIFDRIDFLTAELDKITNSDEYLEQLKTEINDSRIKLGKLAEKLTDERRRAVLVFNEKITRILKYLGMENSVFDIQLTETETDSDEMPSAEIGEKIFNAYSNGIDRAEFYISTNKGDTLKPLKDTASGGEISRVMLSIKSIVAEHRAMPMLVFDEIDTGISGKIAQKTGFVMKKLALHHQILAITHLPQIAALGDNNLFVSKRDDEERTSTSVQQLDENAKILSIASMISGEDITEAALESAKALINITKDMH